MIECKVDFPARGGRSHLSKVSKDDPIDPVRGREREMLAKAILSLPNRERLVLTLYYYEELTDTEVERLMAEPEFGVSQIHSSALAHLQIRLSDLGRTTPRTSECLPITPDDIGETTVSGLFLDRWSQEGPIQEIKVRLWRNAEAQDWSVEINGLRHDHVSSEILEDLVETALIVAEEQLMDVTTRRQ